MATLILVLCRNQMEWATANDLYLQLEQTYADGLGAELVATSPPVLGHDIRF